MPDEHLLLDARPRMRRRDDADERADRQAADALAERLQREVELFLRGRDRTPTPDA